MADRTNPGYTFDDWMAEADDRFTAHTGVSIYDVEDQPWHDWYSDGMHPHTAADQAMDLIDYESE